MEVTLPSGFTVDADALPSLRTSQNVKRVETKNGDTVVVLYFDKVRRFLFQWKIEYVSFCRVMEKELPSFIKVWYLIIYIDIYITMWFIVKCWAADKVFIPFLLFIQLSQWQYNCMPTTVKYDGICSEKAQCGMWLTEFKPIITIQHSFWWHQKRIANFQMGSSVFQLKCFEARVTKKTTDFKVLWMHKDMMCNGINSTVDCSLNICIPRNKM